MKEGYNIHDVIEEQERYLADDEYHAAKERGRPIRRFGGEPLTAADIKGTPENDVRREKIKLICEEFTQEQADAEMGYSDYRGEKEL